MNPPNPTRGGFILLTLLLLISTCAAAFSTRSARLSGKTDLKPYPWVYLRNGEPLSPGEDLVELAAVGDINLARGVDPREAFRGSSAWLRQADITFANLECALSTRSALPGADETATMPYRLVAQPAAAQDLARAGIDLAGVANNHTLDAGTQGLADTIQALDQAGVASVGAGKDNADAASPLVKTIRGLKIAFLAFNAIPSPDPAQPGWTVAQWQRETALAAVRRAAIQSDAVVVSLHWGYEYETQAGSLQKGIAQELISAGADLVIGHHPHVTQEVLLQDRADGSSGLAALSLGNFLFDQGENAPGGANVSQGLALHAFFDHDGLRAVQLLPIHAGLRPQLDLPSSQLPAVLSSAPTWEKMHFACTADACQETRASTSLPAQSPASGLFHSGQIDLDGDHRPEEVHLENFRISIYSQGRLDWQSPPEWRVLDLALGDVDDDGRADLALALEKPDQQGVMQSHPFVIGYRGGIYRTVWGGSPVRDPVKEVELSDLNGDGKDELIVLEEERGGKGRAVTAWHWHGWGFSLDWRSDYAQYEQMVASGQDIALKKLKN
jgi:poly-gamma-glutamate capsule biosynthesis protein CapA/YwtB (metallophosphatase superfamily)